MEGGSPLNPSIARKTLKLIARGESKKKLTVDAKLKEISGIEFDKFNRLWAINDGGDDPKLYRLDEQGQIAKEILVTNAKNIDWEDMTQNKFGHFFLGDFGNNKNDRRTRRNPTTT